MYKKIVPKLYCNAEYWRLAKLMWMVKRQRQKYKQLQSIYNLMHGLDRTGTKRCNAKTGKCEMAVNCKNVY